MAAERSQTDKLPTQAMTSCRKKKSDDGTFFEDLKDHIGDFMNASMDEHKTCFQKTIKKMFGMSKLLQLETARQQQRLKVHWPFEHHYYLSEMWIWSYPIDE